MDTNATTYQTRIQLITIDDFIATCGNDISKFNGNVKVISQLIKARVETNNYFLTNTFNGYATCRDKVFVKYVTRKKERYEEGISILPDSLMPLDVQKFKLPKETNKWNELSRKEEMIISLQP